MHAATVIVHLQLADLLERPEALIQEITSLNPPKNDLPPGEKPKS
ncbi:MAG: hypothetical protein ACXWIU_08355 [Limisphaerales bacterium]